METTVTKQDLNELREFIKEGFKGVHDRQDITNGRVQKGEIEQARVDEALRNLGREVFSRRRDDDQGDIARAKAAAAVVAVAEDKAVTRRDLYTVGATLCGVGAFWAFMEKILPLLLKVAKP